MLKLVYFIMCIAMCLWCIYDANKKELPTSDRVWNGFFAGIFTSVSLWLLFTLKV